MLFRQFGILLMVGGFLAGQLLATIAQKANLQMAGNVDPAAVIQASARPLNFIIWGDAVALVGLVIYFYGALTSRSGRGTTVTGGTV